MSKFSELKLMLTAEENRNLHIFGLNETELKSYKPTNAFLIDGFQKPYRKDNDSNSGGGLLVYVRNGINTKRRRDLETQDISCLWIEVTPENGKSFLLGNLYMPPDSKIEYNDRFEDFIDMVSKENKEFILFGDLNKNLSPERPDTEWLNFTMSLGLSQMVNQPTRVTQMTSSLIDHIYTNVEKNINHVSVCKLCISDHYAIVCNIKLNFSLGKHCHQTITYRSFKTFDENAFINDLKQVPWETIQTTNCLDEMVEIWNELFLEVINKHSPLKCHRVKKKRQPDWITTEILDLMKGRNKCKINGNMDRYKFLRNKVSALINISKRKIYQVQIEESKENPRTMWKLFRKFWSIVQETTYRKYNWC